LGVVVKKNWGLGGVRALAALTAGGKAPLTYLIE